MKKIALLGVPGSGKSTLSARVFTELKDLGYNGELVQEYIREHINRVGKVPSVTFQSIIYERQLQKEQIVSKKMDFMVTDSPHILSYIFAALYLNYDDIDQIELLSDLYMKFLTISRTAYDLVYVLEPSYAPKNDGVRYQTDEDMRKLRMMIPTFLEMHNIPYKILSSEMSTVYRAKIIIDDFIRSK